MRQLKEEALALAGTLAVVLVGSLAFVTLTMPFVFPFAAALALALAWRHRAQPTAAQRTPAAGPRVKPAGRRSPSLFPA
jgi:uncharacterized membrane protein